MCIEALGKYGRPDVQKCGVVRYFKYDLLTCSYEFGQQAGNSARVLLIERWNKWEDLDKLLVNHVVPAIDTYNQLLASPFDPAKHTQRITLA